MTGTDQRQSGDRRVSDIGWVLYFCPFNPTALRGAAPAAALTPAAIRLLLADQISEALFRLFGYGFWLYRGRIGRWFVWLCGYEP